MVCGSFRFCWTGFIVLHHIQHVSVCFVCTTILIFNIAKLDQSKRVQTTSESQQCRHVMFLVLVRTGSPEQKDETCCIIKFVTLFWNFESAVPRSTPCNLSRGRERSWWTVWIRVAVGLLSSPHSCQEESRGTCKLMNWEGKAALYSHAAQLFRNQLWKSATLFSPLPRAVVLRVAQRADLTCALFN